MKNLECFKKLTAKELLLIAVGLATGVAAYQFINGVYTGIKLALAN